MSPSTVRPSFDVVRVTTYENFCTACDRVTQQYEWSDGKTDCQSCLTPEPRALPMLPREDGLGFGLHATTPPARWTINWPAVCWAVAWLFAGGIWVLASYGLYRWIAG